jgi:DNA-binding NarL/FixJ family response regulator
MIFPASEPSLRCLIVDDNAAFLSAARSLLEREGMEVVGIATNSAAALELAEQLHPDVTLVDIDLGGESGFDLTEQLAGGDRRLSKHVILVSTHSERDFWDLIVASSADGFIPKASFSTAAIERILKSS